jgi:hypothetical protein
MSEVTRFYNRDTDQDGPVSGAIQVISVGFDDVANSETVHRQVKFPAGMGFEITDISVVSGSVTSDPALTIGSTAAGTQIVAAVNVTTNLGALTIKEGTIAAGGVIDVRVVADAGDAADNISVTIAGHVASPPTTLAYRS